jgi:hypothetical protein
MAEWPHNPHWCQRHWQPCPRDHRNGILASVLIMEQAMGMMPADVRRGSATGMNSWLENQIVPTCCRLGDEAMDRLWSHC